MENLGLQPTQSLGELETNEARRPNSELENHISFQKAKNKNNPPQGGIESGFLGTETLDAVRELESLIESNGLITQNSSKGWH